MYLNTSLLRERFTIEYEDKSDAPLVAVGNRILLPLQMSEHRERERIIIRAHSMHTTLRMAAHILHDFYRTGPLLNRSIPYDWYGTWEKVIADYEKKHTPETWCGVYNNGRCIFQQGKHHPFLDVIEQCDIKNRAEYDKAVDIAEDIFRQAGQNVRIKHDVNIALVIGAMDDHIRCGVIVRSHHGTSTFNFQIFPGKNKELVSFGPHHGLELASSFLEAIQLAVTAGFMDANVRKKRLSEKSPEAMKVQTAQYRIGRLSHYIQTMENIFKIRYRPERPNFQQIFEEARSKGFDS